jgi:amino acid adenylation domain-containing protein
MYGILKTGAAYVPVDAPAPAERNAFILGNCKAAAVVLERRFEPALREELDRLGAAVPPLLLLDPPLLGGALKAALAQLEREDAAPATATVRPPPDALAYILYTSGSTGRPKGVMLSHRNAVSFLAWCTEAFHPVPEDRFSSHAPFHFDLSILDVHLPLQHGATLVLVSADAGKDPARVARILEDQRLTVWYSAPSILGLLAQLPDLQERDLSGLRLVLFAGEVFPVKHLRVLKERLPGPAYYNLYGPTETNVCTFHRIPETIPPERSQPYPIGRDCSNVTTAAFDPQGARVPSGEEGELCVTGDGVMLGYWNLPEQTERAFRTDAQGVRWYRTGDVVVASEEGDYLFLGRKDRMVKRRGYRVELGEIEACLYRHPSVKEAAVLAFADEDAGVRVKAFLACHGGGRLSLVKLKGFCAKHLPLYMVPDAFEFREELPRTSTDKVDYQKLKELEAWISR